MHHARVYHRTHQILSLCLYNFARIARIRELTETESLALVGIIYCKGLLKAWAPQR